MIQETLNPTPLSTLWLTSFFVRPEICEAQKVMVDPKDTHFSNFSGIYDDLLSSYESDALANALLVNSTKLQNLYLSDILAQICYKKAKVSSFGYRLNESELNDILKMLSILPLPNLSNKEDYVSSVLNLIQHYQDEKLLERTPLLTQSEFEKCRLDMDIITEKLVNFYGISGQKNQNKASTSTSISIFFRLSLPPNFEQVLNDVLTAVVYTYCMMKDNLSKKQLYFELPSSYVKKCLTIYTQYSKTLVRLKDLLKDKKALLEQMKAKGNDPSFDRQSQQVQIDTINHEIARLLVVLEGHRRDYDDSFENYVQRYNSIQNVKKIHTYFEKSSKILQQLSIGSSEATASLQGLGFPKSRFAGKRLGAFGLPTQNFDFFAELDARIQGLIGITEALDETKLSPQLSAEIEKQLQELKANPLDVLNAGKCEKPIVDEDALNLKRLLVGSLAAFGISLLYGMSVRSKRKKDKRY